MTQTCFDNNIWTLFQKAYSELKKVSELFKANETSWNEHKTKYTIFKKPSDIDNLSLRQLGLSINNHNIQKSCCWWITKLDHINIIENKISENLGLFYKANNLDKKAMVSHY